MGTVPRMANVSRGSTISSNCRFLTENARYMSFYVEEYELRSILPQHGRVTIFVAHRASVASYPRLLTYEARACGGFAEGYSPRRDNYALTTYSNQIHHIH
jgi:hypothetical protein